MTEKNKKKEGAYSQLTGFRRAVPIILVALAVFTGLCFIMQDTGALGKVISQMFLGLFSIGGYFIPFFLALHAVFYASDVQKKRLLGRVIFTVLTVCTISALTHTITFYSDEKMVFAAKQFYSDGIELRGGGFIGGTISFCITSLFGNIGLIICAILMFALYVTYFLSSGTSVFPKLFAKIKKGVAGIFASQKEQRANNKQKRINRKEEKRIEELAAEQDVLTDDEFFSVENGMKEIAIPALDIKEVRSDSDLEANPHLQEKVFHKSEVRDDDAPQSRFDYGDTYTAAPQPEKQRTVNLDYSTTDSEHDLSVSVKDSVFTARDDDIIIDSDHEIRKETQEKHETVKEQSADDLFANGKFSAYDVKINEELSNRPSSKATKVEKEPAGISEFEKSIADISPEEVEKARQRADFEMRKRANIEAQKRYAEAQAEIARNNARAANESERVRSTEDNTVTFTFGTPEPETNRYASESNQNTGYSQSVHEAYIPDYMKNESQQATRSAEENRQSYSESAPYTAQASDVGSNEIRTENVPREEDRRAEAFANAISDYEKETFKPYSAPTVASEPAPEENEIRVSRTMLEPNVTQSAEVYSDRTGYAAESVTESVSEPVRTQNYSSYESSSYINRVTEDKEEERENVSYVNPVTESEHFESAETYEEPTAFTTDEPSDDEGAVYPEQFDTFAQSEDENEYYTDNGGDSFDESDGKSSIVFDIDGDDGDEDTVVTAPEEDDSSLGYEEIPPEERNSDVIKQRSMFSFLRDEKCEDDDEAEFPERPEAVRDEEDSAPWQSGVQSASTDSEADSDEDDEEEAYVPQQRSAFAEKMAAMEKQRAAQVSEPEEEEDSEPEAERPDYTDYVFPSIDLLAKGKFEEDENQEEEKNANAEKLVDALLQFNVRISIKAVDRGPRITRYEIVPARGVKVNSVTSLFNDIQLSLGVEGMRMEAPIPGKSAIGVEIPNKKPSTVLLRDLVETDEFISAPSKTMSCLGKDVTGNPVFADIAKMPHILIAGATGMGKSVCINAVLLSILYKAKPDEVKLIMIDPKKVEFARYNGIPHLLVPVVTDVKQAAGALMWAVEQMEKRYDLLQQLEVSKLDTYNEKVRQNPSLGEPLPKIIIVIDELNDIMLQVRKPAEDLIMSIAQKARAAGIHLIIGTQRPSVDVITGVIKANIPSRISCKVASYNDSKTILEQAGAEKLLNNGDMLYIPAGAPKALRVQGAFVTDDEVSAVARHIKSQAKGNIYDERALEEINKAAQKCQKGKGGDDVDDEDDDNEEGIGLLNDQQFLDAVDIAIRSGKISTSLLQRKLRIGYSKAAMFIDNMEDLGIVGEPCGSKPREVLITKDEWHESLARRSLD